MIDAFADAFLPKAKEQWREESCVANIKQLGKNFVHKAPHNIYSAAKVMVLCGVPIAVGVACAAHPPAAVGLAAASTGALKAALTAFLAALKSAGLCGVVTTAVQEAIPVARLVSEATAHSPTLGLVTNIFLNALTTIPGGLALQNADKLSESILHVSFFNGSEHQLASQMENDSVMKALLDKLHSAAEKIAGCIDPSLAGNEALVFNIETDIISWLKKIPIIIEQIRQTSKQEYNKNQGEVKTPGDAATEFVVPPEDIKPVVYQEDTKPDDFWQKACGYTEQAVDDSIPKEGNVSRKPGSHFVTQPPSAKPGARTSRSLGDRQGLRL